MEPRDREAPRRRAAAGRGGAVVSLVDWLERDGDELRASYERLYVPRNDPRYLRRNALVALGNAGGSEHVALVERAAAADDELCASTPSGRSPGCGAERSMTSATLRQTERWIAWMRARRRRVRRARGRRLHAGLPAGLRARGAGSLTAVFARRRAAALARDPSARRTSGSALARRRRARVRHRDRRDVRVALLVRVREPDPLGADLRRRRGGAPLRARRRHRAAARADPVPLVRRALARHALRPAGVPRRPRVVPGRDLPDHAALIVGWLVARLATRPRSPASARPRPRSSATSSGAASTCSTRRTAAPARSRSSLELDQAFGAFIRELRGLLAFDRVAIVLAEAGSARVMAAAGEGDDRRLPAGLAAADRGLDPRGRPARRRSRLPARPRRARYPEEHELAALGLRSRVAAPLLVGSRADRDALARPPRARRVRRRRRSS